MIQRIVKPKKEFVGLLLIVDDNKHNLRVLSRILESQGFDTALATGARQMFDFLESELPDLILMDVMMPDMDGYSACTKLKSEPRFKEIPVIFLTALSGSRNITEGFKCGAADFISKPFEPIEVIERVKNHIELKLLKDRIVELLKEQIRLNQTIEEQKELLESMAVLDQLTKVVNKQFAELRIVEEIARFKRTGQHFSIAIIELDRMDLIKERFGNDAVDRVLCEIANFFMDIKRHQDIVARWEEREFLILMPHTNLAGAETFAERLRNKVEKMNFKFEDYSYQITITIGVAEYNSMVTLDEIVERSYNVLENGKALGGNRVTIDARYATDEYH